MSSYSSSNETKKLARSYLDSRISANELVRLVDDLVAAGYGHDCDLSTCALIDAFQDQLALYVPDEVTRKEAPDVYFGEDELRVKVEHFLQEMTKLQNC